MTAKQGELLDFEGVPVGDGEAYIMVKATSTQGKDYRHVGAVYPASFSEEESQALLRRAMRERDFLIALDREALNEPEMRQVYQDRAPARSSDHGRDQDRGGNGGGWGSNRGNRPMSLPFEINDKRRGITYEKGTPLSQVDSDNLRYLYRIAKADHVRAGVFRELRDRGESAE